MTYNANTLNEELGTAFRNFYPSFRALRMIASAYPGGGKSTLLASTPVSDGYVRVVMDHEDSQAFLDAGVDGQDVYTPRRQQFKMQRIVYPTLNDYADLYQKIAKGGKVGAVCIDNIAIFQDELKATVMGLASNPASIIALFKKFEVESQLPVAGLMKNWARYQDGAFWAALKLIPRQIITICNKNNVHFIGATEEGNVWEGYGTSNAKIVGKKAKIWDAWYRYTDVILSLSREVNTTKPPKAALYPGMPKNRLQGMNPTWTMDWENFIVEINAANKRTSVDIPEEAMVSEVASAGEDDIEDAVKSQEPAMVEVFSFPELLAWALEEHKLSEEEVRAMLKAANFTTYKPEMYLAAKTAITMAVRQSFLSSAPAIEKVEASVVDEPLEEPAAEPTSEPMVPGTSVPMSEMVSPDFTWPNLLKYAKRQYKKGEDDVKEVLKEALAQAGKPLVYTPQDHIALRAIIDQAFKKPVREKVPDFMKD